MMMKTHCYKTAFCGGVTHVVGSQAGSQSVFAGFVTEADLDVKHSFVVKHSEDQGLIGSVLRAVAH